jgi:hypothetical protein
VTHGTERVQPESGHKRRRLCGGMLALLGSALLLACVLGVVVVNAPALPLPCVSGFAGDPFSGASAYVTYRVDWEDRHVYLIEVGRSTPAAHGGFTSHAIATLRVPLAHPRHC